MRTLIVDIKTEKTGQHLRDQVLDAGADARMRALQSLSHQYGTGSRAALATMLLATLGGESTSTDSCADDEQAMDTAVVSIALIGQVAEPMAKGANDPLHARKKIL